MNHATPIVGAIGTRAHNANPVDAIEAQLEEAEGSILEELARTVPVRPFAAHVVAATRAGAIGAQTFSPLDKQIGEAMPIIWRRTWLVVDTDRSCTAFPAEALAKPLAAIRRAASRASLQQYRVISGFCRGVVATARSQARHPQRHPTDARIPRHIFTFIRNAAEELSR